MFAKDAAELTVTTKCHHTIHTGNSAPVRSFPYKQTPHTARETEKLVRGMLSTKLIEPSTSPWSSPVVLVKKKTGDYRFAVDYRKLNAVTEDLFFSIPTFSEVVDTVAEAKPRLFSTLDLASGFWQVPLDPETKHKTAFVTRDGVYEFNRLPFGLKNAPMAFSMLMNEVLRGINWKFTLVYIDDIIVYSQSFQQHLEHLTEVFDRLADASLKLQPPKCLFAKSRVPYLGHIISAEGIAPDPEKTNAVESFPVPTTKKDLQSYLGLCNYYRRFVQDFSHIAAPLTKLLRKDTKFQWSNEAQTAFEELKQKLTSDPVLVFPDFNREFILYTDASDVAIGYILGQMDSDKKEQVVAYGGRSMNSSERKWGITDKEGLALVEGMHYYRHYLTGKHFTVYTDHSALKSLDLAKQTAGRRQRWYDYMQVFNFTIVHKPGRVHRNADALSRRQYEAPSTPQEEPEPNTFPLVSTMTSPVEFKLTYTTTKDIVSVSTLSGNVLQQCIESENNYNHINSVSLIQDLIQLSKAQLCHSQEQDSDMAPMINYLQDGSLPADPNLILKITRTAPDYDLQEGVLYYTGYAPQGKGHRQDRLLRQLMVPLSLRQELLHAYHDSPMGCHQGFDRTYQRLKQKYWWTTMAKDIKDYIQSCDTCQKIKHQYHATRTPLLPLPTSERFQRIHMDFLGSLPTTSEGHKHILLIVDAFTKWPEAFPMKSTHASEVARVFFDEFICRYGAPTSILTDRGQQFMSHLLEHLCKLLQIKKIATTAYHPQTNSSAERMNGYILQGLRAYTNDFQTNWHENLQSVMLSYRTTPATRSTKCSPYVLMFGKECSLPIDVELLHADEGPFHLNEHYQKLCQRIKTLTQFAATNIKHSQDTSKHHYDKHTKKPSFELGDHVYLKINKTKKGLSPKLTAKYQGPYYIVDVNPNNTYLLRNSDTHIIRRGRVHSSQLKRCIERTRYNNQQTQQQNQQVNDTPSATTQDTQISTQNTSSQEDPSEPLVIDKIHRATRPQQGKRWYYVKIKGQRGTRVVPEDSLPQHMKEAFHIQKTLSGRARKRTMQQN